MYRNYELNVDREALKGQIETLSGLLAHLSAEEYERTVGGVVLLEEILIQHDEKILAE